MVYLLRAYRFRLFLGVLFGVILGMPIGADMVGIDTTPIGLTAIVIAAYVAAQCRRRYMAIAAEIAVLGAIWACNYFPGSPFEGFQYIMVSGLLVFVLVLVGDYLRGVVEIDQEALAGSVCAYLLFGFVCGGLYAAFESWWPNSIQFAELGRDAGFFDFVYFSFVVLTTIGFGDVVPVNAMSRSVAMIEGIIGLFYVVIVVSRLVSLYHQEVAGNEVSGS